MIDASTTPPFRRQVPTVKHKPAEVGGYRLPRELGQGGFGVGHLGENASGSEQRSHCSAWGRTPTHVFTRTSPGKWRRPRKWSPSVPPGYWTPTRTPNSRGSPPSTSQGRHWRRTCVTEAHAPAPTSIGSRERAALRRRAGRLSERSGSRWSTPPGPKAPTVSTLRREVETATITRQGKGPATRPNHPAPPLTPVTKDKCAHTRCGGPSFGSHSSSSTSSEETVSGRTSTSDRGSVLRTEHA